MPNRREFLQTGAAVSAAAMNGLLPSGAAAAGATPIGALPRKVIFDDRYAEARMFAAAVAARGVAVRGLEHGDVTRCYDELDQQWRQSPSSLAGTTQFGPMFVLERLGLERGLRMALRVEHRPQTGETLRHEISADAHTIALARELVAAGVEWPLLMAALICTGGGSDVSSRGNATLAGAGTPPRLLPSAATDAAAQAAVIHYYTPRRVQQGYGDALDGPLFSWLLVPRTA